MCFFPVFLILLFDSLAHQVLSNASTSVVGSFLGMLSSYNMSSFHFHSTLPMQSSLFSEGRKLCPLFSSNSKRSIFYSAAAFNRPPRVSSMNYKLLMSSKRREKRGKLIFWVSQINFSNFYYFVVFYDVWCFDKNKKHNWKVEKLFQYTVYNKTRSTHFFFRCSEFRVLKTHFYRHRLNRK